MRATRRAADGWTIGASRQPEIASSLRTPEGCGLRAWDATSKDAVAGGASRERAFGEWLARLISDVGSPPVQGFVVVGLTAAWLASPGAWIWAGIYLLVAVLLPLLHVIWLVSRGWVTDLHIRIREQRIRPLLVTIACAGLGWLVLVLAPAPDALATVAAAVWLQTVAILLITLRWKISVHSAAAAGATAIACVFLGTVVPLLLTVPLVAWSRVKLRRHTLAQTVVGSFLGFAIFFAAGAAIVG